MSTCWPGLDCGADLLLTNKTLGEENISSLLFLDTCEEVSLGRRHCTTEFVRTWPPLVQGIRKENSEEENLNKHFAKSDIQTHLIQFPRMYKETNAKTNDVVKQMNKLIQKCENL